MATGCFRLYAGTIGIVTLMICVSANSEQSSPTRFDQVVNRMVKAFNTRDFAAIERDYSETLYRALPPEKSRPFFQGLYSNYGKILRLEPARLTPPGQAVFAAHFENDVLDIKMTLDYQDKMIGLFFLPQTPTVPVVENHQTKFRLPVKGDWEVFWGGDTRELNQHHDFANQQFAFDFVGTVHNGRTYTGDGARNEDYFVFGREILSPADGVVTDVITGVQDNVPGSMNPYSALGNAVFIKHRDYEISVLAHLKQGSIEVRAGDAVKSGQVIGLCGNSGNSSEPHLHYHLQNTPIIQDGAGIKVLFENVVLVKNRKELLMDRYSPIKGDVVRGESE